MSLCGNAWPAVKANAHVRLAWFLWVDSMANVSVAVAPSRKAKETGRNKNNFYGVHKRKIVLW